jgi:photosynthetic reaction center cytochrome c subunit
MTRQISMLAVSAIALILILFAGRSPLRGAPGEPPAKTAAEEFKNIQVLKNIPADQLIPTMQFIGASLGVECEFCHVGREMDKDDKKAKKTAREMMRMMFAVNQNNFSGEREVTCNTCHRGSIHPQAIPAIATEAPKPGTTDGDPDDAASLASWPSGSSVMAKYLEALGGKLALEKVTTRVEKGNALLAGGHGLPIEILAKSPDERVSVMHTANGDSVTAFNGHVGWLAAPGRPLREMSAADQYAARLDATVMFPANLAATFDELKLQPHPEAVDGHAATVVWGITKGHPPVRLYFDPQSGLLLRMLHYDDTALGLNPTQVDYSEYHDVGGVKTPYRWTIARPSGAFTIQLDEVQNNAPIDAAKFVEPAQPPESGTDSNPAH